MNDPVDRDALPQLQAVHAVTLTPESVTAVATLATSLGLETVRVDLAGCEDKAGLLERIAAALALPSWFGANWDALYDCLLDLSWQPGQGWVLILENAHDLRRAAPDALDTALAIMNDAATAWQARGVPLRVLVAA
jgi:RNAse (barnase) inhibitor barstar